MQEISKPQITKIKERANVMYQYFKAKDGFIPKKELCFIMGWEYNPSNERRVRDVIALLATKKPIISTSDNRGYKLAQLKEDVEEVEHTWKEIDKRIAELENRKKPLIEFYEKNK